MRTTISQTRNHKKSPFMTLMNKVTQNEQETFELGNQFAKFLSAGSVVALFGQLGSGKTRFIQGVCAGLNVRQNVKSPSFTLINEYHSHLKVYHFDFYRIFSVDEAIALGAEEYFYGDGICLIEWADRVLDILPAERFEIFLKQRYEPDWETKREIHVRRIAKFADFRY